jgi:hypothetical protein
LCRNREFSYSSPGEGKFSKTGGGKKAFVIRLTHRRGSRVPIDDADDFVPKETKSNGGANSNAGTDRGSDGDDSTSSREQGDNESNGSGSDGKSEQSTEKEDEDGSENEEREDSANDDCDD